MRTKLPVTVVAFTSLALVSGCGSSKPPAGHDLAALACKSSGNTAASYAAQAAATNPLYSGLATDERAAAAQEALAGDAAGLGSGTAATLLTGQGAGFTVIGDCAKLGLPVTH